MLFLISYNVYAIDNFSKVFCESLKLDYKDHFVVNTDKKNLCLLYDKIKKDYFLISEKCLENKCQFQRPSQIILLKNSKFGSPGNNVCQKLEGKSLSVDYKFKGKKYSTTICKFSADEYISISYLVNIWGDNIVYE